MTIIAKPPLRLGSVRGEVFITKLGSPGSKALEYSCMQVTDSSFQMIPKAAISKVTGIKNKDLLPPINEARGAGMLKLGCLEIQGEMSVKGCLEHRVNGMQLAPEDVFDLLQILPFVISPL